MALLEEVEFVKTIVAGVKVVASTVVVAMAIVAVPSTVD